MADKPIPWSDYPVGTIARCIFGGHWTKTEHGWKWMREGGTFPTPGADVSRVILPGELADDLPGELTDD